MRVTAISRFYCGPTRAPAQFARACERSGVPAQFMALKGLYSKPAVLDIISYLKFLNNYHESSAVWRVINMPFLMIPNADIVKITQYGYKKSQSIYESLNELPLISGLTEHGVAGIDKLLEMASKHGAIVRERKCFRIDAVIFGRFGLSGAIGAPGSPRRD